MLEQFDFIVGFDGGSNLDKGFGKTGSAIYERSTGTVIENSRLYRDVTNNFTELKALSESFDIITDIFKGKKIKILFVGDSKYVIQSFNEWVFKWCKPGFKATWFSSQGPLLNQDIIKYIYYNYITESNYDTTLVHTYGHKDPNKPADLNKAKKNFEKQGFNFTQEEVIFLMKLNRRADKLSSCIGINPEF